jgi:hypothetical protein
MLWFVRGLRRGVVTTRYPAEVDAWTVTLPGPPAFHSRRLTRELADRLEQECPSRALRRDHGVLVVDLGACTACGRCLEIARGAARPSGATLLAAREREALVKRIPIRGGDDGE